MNENKFDKNILNAIWELLEYENITLKEILDIECNCGSVYIITDTETYVLSLTRCEELMNTIMTKSAAEFW